MTAQKPLLLWPASLLWKALGFAVAGLLALIVAYNVLYPPAPIVQSRATTVVAALERYHHDHGSYPATLGDLAPAYLASVPTPGWRTSWMYDLYPKENIALLVYYKGVFVFPGRWYGWSSATQQWKCLQGTFPVYLGEYPCFGYTQTPQSIPSDCPIP